MGFQTAGTGRTGRWRCCRQLLADTEVELSCSHLYELLRTWGCRRGRPRPGLRIPVRGRRKTLNKIKKLVAQPRPRTRCSTRRGRRSSQSEDRLPETGTPTARADSSATSSVRSTGHLRENAAVCPVPRVPQPTDERSGFISCSTITSFTRLASSVRGTEGAHRAPRLPDDNVIERLWKQLHDHVTRNHRHRSIESLVAAVQRFLDNAQPSDPGGEILQFDYDEAFGESGSTLSMVIPIARIRPA